jgi:hypothetical protein
MATIISRTVFDYIIFSNLKKIKCIVCIENSEALIFPGHYKVTLERLLCKGLWMFLDGLVDFRGDLEFMNPDQRLAYFKRKITEDKILHGIQIHDENIGDLSNLKLTDSVDVIFFEDNTYHQYFKKALNSITTT